MSRRPAGADPYAAQADRRERVLRRVLERLVALETSAVALLEVRPETLRDDMERLKGDAARESEAIGRLSEELKAMRRQREEAEARRRQSPGEGGGR